MINQESFGPEFEVYGDKWHLGGSAPHFEIDRHLIAGFTIRTDQTYRTRSLSGNENGFFTGYYVLLKSDADEIVARSDWKLARALDSRIPPLTYVRNGCSRRLADRVTSVELSENQGERSRPLARSHETWRDADSAKRIAYRVSGSDRVEPIEYALMTLYHELTIRKGNFHE